ncbi:MAG: putative beta-lysine N-acetyltransferase [Desulfuromonas sp.]|nr:MAG: putative beta-lysine N-acetyltransferase [Desulfuromonas sp.]
MEIIGESLIQHGKANDRAYVMKIGKNDYPGIVGDVVALARANGYSKIFVKAPAFARPAFMDSGFVEEARVPGLFQGEEDGFFLSRFFSPEREAEGQPDLVAEILEAARQKRGKTGDAKLPAGHACRVMQKDDVEEMARLYRQVFASYPFPIHDPDYLARTMDENLSYYGIWIDSRLIALSSAEIDFAGKNAEMTDFATLPECRGSGLATYLLDQMESGIKQSGIQTAYTIARAYSFGMNITFAKHGYAFGGTLVHNTQISGNLESMNVWYKHL